MIDGTAPSVAAATCANCGAALHGRYCHACGQKATTRILSSKEFAHEALDELAHLDGKMIQTARLLLFSPGKLTNELLAGRRARYLPPLRVYLTCSLLFFGLAALAPSSTRSMVRVKSDDAPSATTGGTGRVESSEAVAERIRERLIHNLPRAVFVLMPLFAALTWLFYRKVQPYYMAHLYYALHFHAFVFLIMAISAALSLGGRYLDFAGRTLTLSVAPYYYVGLSRVFGGSGGQTALKGTAIGMLYFLATAGVMLGLAFLAVRAG